MSKFHLIKGDPDKIAQMVNQWAQSAKPKIIHSDTKLGAISVTGSDGKAKKVSFATVAIWHE